jgi:hypothetical protein
MADSFGKAGMLTQRVRFDKRCVLMKA